MGRRRPSELRLASKPGTSPTGRVMLLCQEPTDQQTTCRHRACSTPAATNFRADGAAAAAATLAQPRRTTDRTDQTVNAASYQPLPLMLFFFYFSLRFFRLFK